MSESTGFWEKISAAGTMASVFGVLAGLSNIQFGFIEAVKGNIRPDNFMFKLYNQPALTVIPSYLLTGILGIGFSILFIIWSIGFVKRENGGVVMILIAVLQMLFGASLIRISQEIIFGVIGTRINKPLRWWRKAIPSDSVIYLTKLWAPSFIICSFLYLVHISTIEIESFFGGNNRTVNLILMIIPSYFNLFLFIFTLISGFAHDIWKQRVKG